MTAPAPLQNAPIVEAALDIAVSLPDDVDQERLALFQDKLAGRYPTKQLRAAWRAKVEIKSDRKPVASAAGAPDGYLFASADGKQIVQVRKGGFTFSRLRPYEDWGRFSGEALDLWGKFEKHVKPTQIVRVGLRYINRILLPLPLVDLEDYLLTVPKIAPELPQIFNSFFVRIVIPFNDLGISAIVTETIEEADVKNNVLPLILDIDVIKEGAFPPKSDKLAAICNELRVAKDQVFFKSITPKLKEMFE